MENIEFPKVDIYSDGGAEPNPGKGGFGVIMSFNGRSKEFSQGYKLTTNNRMELMGIIYGLERLKATADVTVYTDSMYVVNGIEKGWALKWKAKDWFQKQNKKAKNHDLWARLLELIGKNHQVKFHWIKGHAGHPQNERCDVLADQALNGSELQTDTIYEQCIELEDEKVLPMQETVIRKTKTKKEGDQCRNCGISVVKKTSKKREQKPGQTHFYEFYLFCPGCKRVYMVDDGKRYFKGSANLFSSE